jgi:hypothetical protein
MERYLRPTIACSDAPRLAPNSFAALGIVRQFSASDANLLELLAKPELVEFSHGMRQQIDPYAQRENLRSGFKNANRETCVVKAQSSRQSADASSRDKNLIAQLNVP